MVATHANTGWAVAGSVVGARTPRWSAAQGVRGIACAVASPCELGCFSAVCVGLAPRLCCALCVRVIVVWAVGTADNIWCTAAWSIFVGDRAEVAISKEAKSNSTM